ncbi:hypothetical protein [Lihuaxuella thermophila]|uniref:Uncharacterized protein n=1 Tax=Lihuaxuella thermophila TaxID=1173111 RepID=A0A1H8HT78_9BACL|nr:hypothetical protein [Lihuaxuella thermophila]SEN58898.1 hypothetical protein SAMN05444955_11514 [Lihuaxuella thermophila]
MKNKANQKKSDTKEYVGPDLAYSAGSPNQHKTRVTNQPHLIPEDPLPPGETDLRQVKTDPS